MKASELVGLLEELLCGIERSLLVILHDFIRGFKLPW